jgi:hypothetical protein
MDVHEYSPYGNDWKSYGYRKNSEVTLGTNTNPNVSKAIRDFSEKDYLPFFLEYLGKKGFSAFEYCPGGPPDSSYFRHSTFDVNDGRQSLGAQNTFSFIQEGMNGNDSYVENLKRRTKGQCAGMRCLLEYAYLNKDKIKTLVAEEREQLVSGRNNAISIQSEHVNDGRKLALPLYSYSTGTDTLVIIEDYRPVVKSIFDVQRPEGYLIPLELTELVDWTKRHSFKTSSLKNPGKYIVKQYFIDGIDTIDFEGDSTVNPQVVVKELRDKIPVEQYIFIPTDQLKVNLLVSGLEVKSTLGLVTYKNYAHLLKDQEAFPVLRVVERER